MGDAVAIVAGETEAAVDKALKIIKVKYQVLDAILDFHDAKDNKILIHPKITGNPDSRLVQIINEISVLLLKKEWEILKKHLRNVNTL